MKNIIKILVCLFMTLNASTYALLGGDDSDWVPEDPKDKISLYVDFVDSSKKYVKVESLDYSQEHPLIQYLFLCPFLCDNAVKKDIASVEDDMGLSNNLNLISIHVHGNVFAKILSATYLPKVEFMSIERSAAGIDFSGFPNLKELIIDCGFTDETVESLLQLPNLKILRFRNTQNQFNDKTVKLLSEFKNLKELYIYQKLGNSPNGTPRAAKIKKQLQSMLPNTKVRVGWKYDF